MNATELFHADGASSGIFYCGKCRIVYRDRSDAENCCQQSRCCECGEVCRQYMAACDACKDLKNAKRESERFEAAEKVAEFKGYLYVEGLGYRDGYFAGLDDLEDYLANEANDDGAQPNRPQYVWTCSPHSFCQLDYDRIIEDATQEAYEDWDSSEIVGSEAMEQAIEKFNEANRGHVSWEPNYEVALLIPPLPATTA